MNSPHDRYCRLIVGYLYFVYLNNICLFASLQDICIIFYSASQLYYITTESFMALQKKCSKSVLQLYRFTGGLKGGEIVWQLRCAQASGADCGVMNEQRKQLINGKNYTKIIFSEIIFYHLFLSLASLGIMGGELRFILKARRTSRAV